MYYYPVDPKEDQHFYGKAAYAAVFSCMYYQRGGSGLVWGAPLKVLYDNGNVTHTFHYLDIHPAVTANDVGPEYSE